MLCGTWRDALDLDVEDVIDGAKRSTMDELTQHTVASDKVLRLIKKHY
jgi:sulfur relay (sulfurtransferase) complex TusBCD TusD component (DsrE family)